MLTEIRMKQRVALLCLTALLFVSVIPAFAEEREIDPADPPPTELNEADATKLNTLLSGVTPLILSSVSPDDAAFFAGFVGGEEQRRAFIAVADGKQTPVDQALLDFAPISEYAWTSAQSLVYLSKRYDFDLGVVAVLVTLDRTTGTFDTRDLDLPGFPISLAPNGNRLLVQLPTSDPVRAAAAKFQSPFDLTVRVRPASTPEQARALGLDSRKSDGLRAFASTAVTLGIFDLRTGAVRELTVLPEGSELTSYAWNPDGARLALVRNSFGLAQDLQPNRSVLANQFTQDAMGNLDPAKNPFFQQNVLDIFDLNAPGSPPLASVRAPAVGNEVIYNVEWSTDGQTLLAQMQRPAQIAGRRFPSYTFPDDIMLRFFNANGVPQGSFDRPELQGGFFTYSTARFVSPDEIIFSSPAGPEHKLFYYNRRSGEFRGLPTQAGLTGPRSWQATRLSRQLIYAQSSFVQPPELFRITWEGQAIYRLTWSNFELETQNQVQVHRVTFRLTSGAQRDGYLVQPKDAPFPPRQAPIVVWQEGGPSVWMGNMWGAHAENPTNLLANFGISVLVVPLTGREGYGAAFIRAQADRTNFGQMDIDEMAQIVNQMLGRGWTKHGKIGITGCSYGGYFTTQSIVRYPELYAAANTQCSFVEMIHNFQFIEATLSAYLQGGGPESKGAEYVRDSPLYNAGRIKTPTLIFHGTEDFQPIELMQSFHDQIKANGAPVRLLTFRGEGHGLSLPASQRVATEAQLLWFRQYLGVK